MAARRSWSLFERRRLPPESQLELGKRRVRLPPNLANLSPAGRRAQDHESDVARDVKPCLYVVPPVAAHLCRPVVGCLGRPEFLERVRRSVQAPRQQRWPPLTNGSGWGPTTPIVRSRSSHATVSSPSTRVQTGSHRDPCDRAWRPTRGADDPPTRRLRLTHPARRRGYQAGTSARQRAAPTVTLSG